MLRRKITFTSEEERRAAATKIKTEAMQCKSFFKDVAGDMADFDSPFDTLATLAGVLSSDEEMVCKYMYYNLQIIQSLRNYSAVLLLSG